MQAEPEFVVPGVDWARTTRRVLTIDWIDGVKLSDVAAVAALDLDRKQLAATLVRSFLRQAIAEGFFHADMHQGNLFVLRDGRIAVVDFGIMGRLDRRARVYLAEILYGLITGDYKRVAEIHFEAGYVPSHHDVGEFATALRAVGEPIRGLPVRDISISDMLDGLFSITRSFEMAVQPHLLLLQKTMVMVEGVALSLDPQVNMWEVAAPFVSGWMRDELGPRGAARRQPGSQLPGAARPAAGLPPAARQGAGRRRGPGGGEVRRGGTRGEGSRAGRRQRRADLGRGRSPAGNRGRRRDIAVSTVTRFAPSPTGRIHAGNVRTALVNWLAARAAGGTFVLRIDDTDLARSEERYVEAIHADLGWLGLVPDRTVRQSERFVFYEAALQRLAEQGCAYRAYETAIELDIKRKVQASQNKPPVYDRAALALTDADHARFVAEGVAPHWRFRLDTDAPIAWDDAVRGQCHVDPASLSDPVVRRADGTWLYMLPSVVDDIDLGVTLLARGEDHVTNSSVQLQMFAALGAAPPKFAHLALLTGADAALSKRLGSEGVDAWRAAGIEPQAVAALLARIGTSKPVEPVTELDALVAGFNLAHFSRSAARFSTDELAQLNARTVHLLDFAAVRARLPDGMTEAAWLAVRGNLATVAEAADWWRVIAGQIDTDVAAEDREFVAAAREALAALPWQGDVWHAWTGPLKAATGRKGRLLFQPLRRALTGLDHGPEMAALLPLIGRDAALARLSRAAGGLSSSET